MKKSEIYLCNRTFSENVDTLPTINEIRQHIITDGEGLAGFHRRLVDNMTSYGFDSATSKTFEIREEYVKKSFLILSHELLLSIKKMVDEYGFNKIYELSCGSGWFTYWLRKYGVNVLEAVDDTSWKQRGEEEYLSLVKKTDSIKFVKEKKDADLFILSWSYMDDVAERVWKEMQIGQYLLYIGEHDGGCNANEEFFKLIYDDKICSSVDMNEFCISFWGIHDTMILLKKLA